MTNCFFQMLLAFIFVLLLVLASKMLVSDSFVAILTRFSLPTCVPKSTKIDEKLMPRCLPILASFFDRFLIGFCSQLRPPEPQKSSPRCSESTIFQKSSFRVKIGFPCDFGANLALF